MQNQNEHKRIHKDHIHYNLPIIAGQHHILILILSLENI